MKDLGFKLGFIGVIIFLVFVFYAIYQIIIGNGDSKLDLFSIITIRLAGVFLFSGFALGIIKLFKR